MRPQTLRDYVGQERAKKLLLPELKSKELRNVLLMGGPGLGKTTLAQIIARAAGRAFIALPADATPAAQIDALLKLPIDGYTRSGQATEKAERYVVFLDEAHTVQGPERWLYSAMEDGEVPHGSGVSWIPQCTFVLATTDVAAIKKPLRDRCPVQLYLEPYVAGELQQIVLGRFSMSKSAASEIAKRSRGTARLAINYAQSVLNYGGLEWFDAAGIDEEGLTVLDRKYLDALYRANGSLSLASLAATLCEQPRTLTELVEPFLLQLGRIEVTGKGRKLTVTERGARAEAPTAVADRIAEAS